MDVLSSIRQEPGEILEILSAVPVYMFHVTFEGSRPAKKFHSPNCEMILGYTPEEYERDPDLWCKMIYEEDRTRVLEFLNDFNTGDSVACSEIVHRIKKKDGEVVWALNRLTRTYDRRTGLSHLAGVIMDITKQKQAEEALREGERRYRALFENASDIVFTVDMAGYFLDINKTGLKLLGYREDEARGMNIFDLVSREFIPTVRSLIMTKPQGSGSSVCEMELITRSGSKIPLEVNACSLLRGDGQCCTLGVGRDIAWRRREEQIRQSLVDRLRSRVMELNCLYRISTICSAANESLEEILEGVIHTLPEGFRLGELLEAGVRLGGINLATGPMDGAAIRLRMDIHVNGAVAGWLEVAYLDGDGACELDGFTQGERNLLDAVAQRLGAVAARIMAQEDLKASNTTLMRTKLELESAYQALEHLNAKLNKALTDTERALIKAEEDREAAVAATKLKDKFVSLVAHDLKSPLSAMTGLMKLVLKNGKETPPEKGMEMLSKSIQAGDNLLAMIEDLLNLSRLQAGAIQPKFQPVHARTLAESALASVSITAEAKGISLENGVPMGLWLFADSSLFSEVLKNLLSNAVKFSRSGDSIRIFQPDNGAAMAVQDTGCGINPSILPHLFRPDVKTSSIGTAGEKGTGLGLPYCEDIMKVHGGGLAVASELGKGTVFSVILPPFKPVILVVDDEENYRKMIEELLEPLGCIVVETSNGEEAVSMIEKGKPNLVILDLFMPGVSGFDLLKKLRGGFNPAAIPILAVTSGGNESRETAFRLGADDLVGKELLREELASRARRLIGKGAMVL